MPAPQPNELKASSSLNIVVTKETKLWFTIFKITN